MFVTAVAAIGALLFAYITHNKAIPPIPATGIINNNAGGVTISLQESVSNLLNAIEIRNTNRIAANVDYSSQIDEVKAALAITQSQIKQIQDTMISDPQKVISLPLLKDQMEEMQKEIANLQNYVQSQAQFIKEAQSQVYWVIAVFAFGLLALIVPVIKATFSTNKKDDKKDED
jgi:hypothetical protein